MARSDLRRKELFTNEPQGHRLALDFGFLILKGGRFAFIRPIKAGISGITDFFFFQEL